MTMLKVFKDLHLASRDLIKEVSKDSILPDFALYGVFYVVLSFGVLFSKKTNKPLKNGI